MSRVVIVGAGIGGLTSAILLARAGHEVGVYERDPAPTPADPEAAWTGWHRPGTPQARLGHLFLPGFHRLMRHRLDDVRQRVLDAGASLLDQAADLPGAERLPEDSDLTGIMARRPIFEAVLAACADAEPGVEIVRGCPVTGLLAASGNRSSDLPTVIGVRTGAESIAADVVIVCGGRTAPLVRWLAELGMPLPEEAEASGFACYTRYFRRRSDAAVGGTVVNGPAIHRESACLLYEVWGADRGTFAVEMVVPVADRHLHGLKRTDVWMATAQTVPEIAEWIDPDRAVPITPKVDVMGRERNVLRHFVVDERPLVRGLHVVGDARCQTDSLYAWGCGNAFTTAVAVVDAIAEHPGDFDSQALVVEASVGEELRGRYEHSCARDRAALRVSRGEPRWSEAEAGTRLIDEVLWTAADHDPEVFRAVSRWDLQLDPVGAIDGDAELVSRARAAIDAAAPGDNGPHIPGRDELAATMAWAAAQGSR
jgi:2-polyprenyl-6-methoxyphenol hydroxylase-like FAD-dependent oxidoreductase